MFASQDYSNIICSWQDVMVITTAWEDEFDDNDDVVYDDDLNEHKNGQQKAASPFLLPQEVVEDGIDDTWTIGTTKMIQNEEVEEMEKETTTIWKVVEPSPSVLEKRKHDAINLFSNDEYIVLNSQDDNVMEKEENVQLQQQQQHHQMYGPVSYQNNPYDLYLWIEDENEKDSSSLSPHHYPPEIKDETTVYYQMNADLEAFTEALSQIQQQQQQQHESGQNSSQEESSIFCLDIFQQQQQQQQQPSWGTATTKTMMMTNVTEMSFEEVEEDDDAFVTVVEAEYYGIDNLLCFSLCY